MKFQIMSDSHVQVGYGLGNKYGKFGFPVAAPSLVLLGGMGRVCVQELCDFIVAQLARFECVSYAVGRDQLYEGKYEEGRELIKAFTEQLTETPPTEAADGKHIAKLGEFHYLHRRTELSSETRARAEKQFRPLNEFFTEEEMVQRERDLDWLKTQLDACANGETPPSATDAINTSSEILAQVDPEEEEVGIYDNTEISLGSQPTGPKLEVEPTAINDAQTSLPTASNPRQGPPHRVVIFTCHPPAHNTTTHRLWLPHYIDDKPVETLLQGRQCWVPAGSNHGVFVESPVHGNDPRNSSKPTETESSKETGHINVD